MKSLRTNSDSRLSTGFSVLFGLCLWACPKLYATDPLDQWKWRNPLPQGADLNDVCYANGQFVAVGGGYDLVLTSPDGIRWTMQHSADGNYDLTAGDKYNSPLSSIAYGNGRFVAVGGADIAT